MFGPLERLFDRFVTFLFFYLRPVFKYFLRRTTGLCELQRICYRHEKGAKRSVEVEKSINLSRSTVIIKIRDRLTDMSLKNGRFNSKNKEEVAKFVEFAVEAICVDKKIQPSLHQEFLVALRICFLQIYGYQQLIYDVCSLKSELYDASNRSHEQDLLCLWEYLMPGVDLTSRVSKQWGEIGFQGDDPKSDFRGMGLLGLKNLLYFAKNMTPAARNILLHSNHPTHGYPFAITGINITFIAYNLLMSGHLKTHFFNTYFSTVCLDDFHKVYCYLFLHFDRFWLKSKPKDVMEFHYIKENFIDEIETKLLDFSTSLRLDSVSQTV